MRDQVRAAAFRARARALAAAAMRRKASSRGKAEQVTSTGRGASRRWSLARHAGKKMWAERLASEGRKRKGEARERKGGAGGGVCMRDEDDK